MKVKNINPSVCNSSQTQVQKQTHEMSPVSQKVMRTFLKMAVVFSVLSAVSMLGFACSIVPGVQLAVVPLLIASAVLLVASSAFLACAGVAKIVSLMNSKFSTPPTYEELMDYKNLPNQITLDDEIARAQMIKDTYSDLQAKHPGLKLMTKNYGLEAPKGSAGLWLSFNMRGLSLIASELKAKHQLNHLYVCESLEAFQSKLLEISQTEGNLKASLIVPTSALSKSARHVPESQHKSSVCIEKKDGKLRMMYMDSQPAYVDEPIVVEKIAKLKNLSIHTGNASFMVFWAIYHSGIDLSQVELSRFIDKREHAYFGCETFALKDSVAFLRTKNFFEKIVKRPKQSGVAIREVIALPADFMKTAQSLTQIEKYVKDYPALANQNLIRREGRSARTLQQAVKLRTKKGYNKQHQPVDQNHYVSTFSVKYHKMLLDSMASLKTKALQNKIDSTFVSVERPLLKQGETPKTMHDLFNKWNGKFSDSPPEEMSV